MTTETFRRHVAGTPAQAMSLLLDVERWPAWRPGLRVIHLSDRPVRAGAMWLDARTLGRREVKFTAHAIEVEPSQSFAYKLSGGGLEALVRWSARRDDERALVAQEVDVSAVGLRGLVTDAKRQFLAGQRATMDHLRHAVAASMGESA